MSTQESLFHGVPILILPISNDQKANGLRAERQGYGKIILLQGNDFTFFLSKLTFKIDHETILLTCFEARSSYQQKISVRELDLVGIFSSLKIIFKINFNQKLAKPKLAGNLKFNILLFQASLQSSSELFREVDQPI